MININQDPRLCIFENPELHPEHQLLLQEEQMKENCYLKYIFHLVYNNLKNKITIN